MELQAGSLVVHRADLVNVGKRNLTEGLHVPESQHAESGRLLFEELLPHQNQVSDEAIVHEQDWQKMEGIVNFVSCRACRGDGDGLYVLIVRNIKHSNYLNRILILKIIIFINI